MCAFTRPCSAYGSLKHRQRGDASCDECRAAENAYRIKIYSPELQRQQVIWKHYRLRQQDYDAIFGRQGGLCMICQGKLRPGRTTHIDHDHRCDHPGKGKFSCAACVRGILCIRCNQSLYILDDPELLARAVRYLGREDVAEILRESRLF